VTELLTTQADMTVALRRLLDETEIRAVLARYARGIDRFDMDLVRSCYHEDATDAHGEYNGGIEGFIDYALSWQNRMESMAHHFNQSTIDLDGDSAWVESYCLCLIRLKAKDGEKPMDILGNIRYVDVFERRDGVWRIARRKLLHDPGRLDPVAIDLEPSEHTFYGRPGRDDPSYDRRPESFLPH
jgi:ketosteroid isomerase-like protein